MKAKRILYKPASSAHIDRLHVLLRVKVNNLLIRRIAAQPFIDESLFLMTASNADVQTVAAFNP